MPLGFTSLFVLTHFNKAGFKYKQSPKFIIKTRQWFARTELKRLQQIDISTERPLPL